MSMFAYVLIRGCKATHQLGLREQSDMKTGFGLISSVCKILSSTFSTDIPIWLKISSILMECLNLTVDGTSTFLTTIFTAKISWLRLLVHLPKPIMKIFQDTTSCREDKFKKHFTQDPMTTFLLSSRWNSTESEEIIGTMLLLLFTVILMLNSIHFWFRGEVQNKFYQKISSFISYFHGRNFLFLSWQSR